MSKRILFVVAAIALGAAGIFYRASNAHTARLQADDIVKADAAGTDTTASLASLRDFVSSHMGASVTVTLKGSFDRAVAALPTPAPTANSSQVYADAQKACAGKSDSITQARCNEAYISSHLTPATPTPAPVTPPKLADYQHVLTSPLWTPDLAGSLLLGALLSIVAAFLARNKKR